MEIFITADWHFGETRLDIMQRGHFSSTEEMNETIIANANKLVKPEDILIVNGDVISNAALDKKSLIPLIGRINGKKMLIRGNHDRSLTDEDFAPYFKKILADGDGTDFNRFLRVEKELDCPEEELTEYQDLYITHYPTQSRPDKFNLVGHIHSAWKVQKNMLNIGVDVHSFYPVKLSKVGFFIKAITDFYDDDVWVAEHAANLPYKNRGKKGRYLDGIK